MLVARAAILIALGITVAGCETTASRPSAGPTFATASPFGEPRAPFGQPTTARPTTSPPPFQRTTESTRTSVGADGTVTTTTTRVGVGFDPARAAMAVAALASQGRPAGYAGVPGLWRMQSSSTGHICMVELYGMPGAPGGAVDARACGTGSTLAGVDNWRLAENGAIVMMRGGGEAIRFQPVGPNRYDATATWGILSTRLALYR